MLLLLQIVAFAGAAHAERNAVFLFEVEKWDWELESISELAFVYYSNTYLSESYDNFYWLVNTDLMPDNFIGTIQEVAQASTVLDLYTVTHGGEMYIMGHYDTKIYTDDLLSLSDSGKMGSLRFVYLGSCNAYKLTDEFIKIGAVSAIGNVDYNVNGTMYPVFIENFGIKNGQDGLPLSQAMQIAVGESGMNYQINGNPDITMMWEPENQ